MTISAQRSRILLSLSTLAVCSAFPGSASPSLGPPKLNPMPSPALHKEAKRQLGRTPLYFEPNQGQADPAVRFLARGGGFTVYITGKEAVFLNNNTRTPIRLEFLGAQDAQSADLLDPIPGVSNYLRGKDASKWQTQVPHYRKARLTNIYPGVDALFYSNDGKLEYDLIVAPGADPSKIRIRWQGVDGTALEPAGDLIVSTSAGDLRHKQPYVYQEIGGQRVPVSASYRTDGENTYAFQLAAWDRKAPLVIDPLLLYSTYLGGSQIDEVLSMAIDPQGSTYFTGYTRSGEFPLIRPIQGTLAGNSDLFITKLSFDGNFVLFSTFIGGEQDDRGMAIAVDPNGGIYVTGITTSFGFPVTPNALQLTFSGAPQDAFVLRLNSGGDAILYATYLGTVDTTDAGNAIAVDGAGSYIVAGDTRSTGFLTTPGVIKRTNNGATDGFVIKFNAGNQVVFSTYLGGNQDEGLNGIVVDRAGEIYIVGATLSPDFPTTTGAIDTTYNGSADAFVVKLAQNGKKLQFATFLGGDGFDLGLGISLEAGGRILVTGRAGPNFPVTSLAYNKTGGGVGDAFVSRINTTGTLLIASTLVGTPSFDYGADVKPAPGGFMVVGGVSESNNFPSTPDAFAFSSNAFGDAFVQVVTPLGNAFTFSSVLGGSGSEAVREMGMDAFGTYYIIGQTFSADYQVQPSSIDTTYGGDGDGFITKFSNIGTNECTATIAPTGTSYQAEGGGGGAAIGPSCSWFAFPSVNWLTLSSNPLSNTTGSLNYTVAPNPGVEPRTGSIHVAGNLLQIVQKGSTTAPPFQDVPNTDPLVDFVRILKNNAITLGCTATDFCPTNLTTRGQMAVFLIRSLLMTDDFDFPETPYFQDVPATHPQFKWIQKLRSLNITAGCTTLNYCPEANVTRGQMAVFLVRSRYGNTFLSPTVPYFGDVPANDPFFPYVQKLRQVGVTTGCTASTYCFNDPTTRAQMAVFLTRMFLTPW